MRKLLNDELPRLSTEEFKTSEKSPVMLVLDNVRSHLNVGSIFRTADAFRLEGIYLCGITGTPPHRDIHKTALGATETVMWKYSPTSLEAVNQLIQEGYVVVAIEQAENAIMLSDFMPQPGKKYALIFGNEVDGVGQDLINASDLVIEIPQWGMKHSLNIAVSVGVAVWDVVSKKLISGF